MASGLLPEVLTVVFRIAEQANELAQFIYGQYQNVITETLSSL